MPAPREKNAALQKISGGEFVRMEYSTTLVGLRGRVEGAVSM